MTKFTETLVEVGKTAPPIGAGGLAIFGIPLSEWLIVLSVVWTVFLLIDKFPTVVRRIGDGIAWIKRKLKE